jgi:hypothetical protein
MWRHEPRKKAARPRDDIRLILELLGLGAVVEHLNQTTTGTALFLARLKVRMMVALIPVSVCIALAAYAAGAVALAIRRARRTGDSERLDAAARPPPADRPIEAGPTAALTPLVRPPAPSPG